MSIDRLGDKQTKHDLDQKQRENSVKTAWHKQKPLLDKWVHKAKAKAAGECSPECKTWKGGLDLQLGAVQLRADLKYGRSFSRNKCLK